jgi:hypothetical protein
MNRRAFTLGNIRPCEYFTTFYVINLVNGVPCSVEYVEVENNGGW